MVQETITCHTLLDPTEHQLNALGRLPQIFEQHASIVLGEGDIVSALAEAGVESALAEEFSDDLMYFVRSWLDYVADAVISGESNSGSSVATVLESMGHPKQEISTKKVDVLGRIVSSSSIIAIAKARYLYAMGGNVFAGARIISSATPIFVDRTEGPIEAIGFFAASRLRLQFWGVRSELEELHIDLTEGDVDMLLMTLERAKKKASQLRRLAKVGRPMVKI